MRSFVRSILVAIFALLLLSWLVPEVTVANTITLLFAAVVLTVLEVFLRPALKILFLPINIITLGLFGWVINVILLYCVMWFVPGFSVSPINLLGLQLTQFWSLTFVSFALSVLQTIVRSVL